MPVLSSFPFVVVRLGCDHCERQGSYRLARLAARFGPDAELTDVLRSLSADCERRAAEGQIGSRACGARFLDLVGDHPPDLPPRGSRALRVIRGGRAA
jgi:hypothetical protein